MRQILATVLKRLICQNECQCHKKIVFRGLIFEEYLALRDNRKKQICFYDDNHKFRIKVESPIKKVA